MTGRTAPTVSRAPFGTLADGREIELVTLRNRAGMVLSIATYGGIVQSLLVPDREGRIADVVLGFSTLEQYVAARSAFVGALIGRYANRIAGGMLSLDGRTYTLERNEGRNSLHGGPAGFDVRVWHLCELAAGDEEATVSLGYVSPDGEMGFPGTLSVTATYGLRDDGTVRLDLHATTDAPTVVNLTSHSYWNLAGEGSGSIADHVLSVDADRYVEVDAELIPTGRLPPVAGTSLDLLDPAPVGLLLADGPAPDSTGGLDVTYVVARSRPGELARAADLQEPRSGRALTVFTTEPGMHVYSGELLDGSLVGKCGRRYEARAGIALEAQHFPDSPNHPGFPSTELRPGEVFSATTVWRLSAQRQ